MKNRRKQLVVDGNFQYRFVLIGLLVSFSLVNITIILGFFISEKELFNASPNVVYAIMVALMEVCALVVVFMLSLKSSHRIAGPITQVKANLLKIGEGDLAATTQFRDNDYFQDLGIQLNNTVGLLRMKIESMRDIAVELEPHVENSSSANDLLQRLLKQLNEFKTEKSPKDSKKEPFESTAVDVASEAAECHQS